MHSVTEKRTRISLYITEAILMDFHYVILVIELNHRICIYVPVTPLIRFVLWDFTQLQASAKCFAQSKYLVIFPLMFC
jgi:hypothetical protein